uniref:Uncharacterized protein n=1 Tax=Ficus carica TaxID=3494 RepID=A0AA87YPW7_FICCA|nr:hypothetical protein TIFTF001_048518 [Ficus carica]GMN18722.1 hypothetical protein TIFTF001_048522 [Ficus carica]
MLPPCPDVRDRDGHFERDRSSDRGCSVQTQSNHRRSSERDLATPIVPAEEIRPS